MVSDGRFLIPANTKKGILIFGLFKPLDAAIISIGVTVTMILLIIFSANNIVSAVLCLLPGLIAAFLVFPFPNYHNIRTAIGDAIGFYQNRRNYRWKGWCSRYEK